MHQQTIDARRELLGNALDSDDKLSWADHQQELLGLRRGGFFQERFWWSTWNDKLHAPPPQNGHKWVSPTHLMFSWAQAVVGLAQQGVVLYGDVGTGKSHLACMTGKYLTVRYRLRSPFYVDWSVFSDDLRSASGGVDNGAYEKLERLHHADFLLIDDLGAERPSEFALSKLFGLLNRRNTPFIVTMNLEPGKWLHNIEAGGSSVRSDDYERVCLEARRIARRLAKTNGYCAAHVEIRRLHG